MTSNDPITAALQELAAHHEQLTQLDARETSHFATLTERLTELTDLIEAQTAYQANTKVVDSTSTALQSLVEMS